MCRERQRAFLITDYQTGFCRGLEKGKSVPRRKNKRAENSPECSEIWPERAVNTEAESVPAVLAAAAALGPLQVSGHTAILCRPRGLWTAGLGGGGRDQGGKEGREGGIRPSRRSVSDPGESGDSLLGNGGDWRREARRTSATRRRLGTLGRRRPQRDGRRWEASTSVRYYAEADTPHRPHAPSCHCCSCHPPLQFWVFFFSEFVFLLSWSSSVLMLFLKDGYVLGRII